MTALDYLTNMDLKSKWDTGTARLKERWGHSILPDETDSNNQQQAGIRSDKRAATPRKRGPKTLASLPAVIIGGQ